MWDVAHFVWGGRQWDGFLCAPGNAGQVLPGAVVLMIDAPFARPENRDRDSWPLTFDEVDRLEQIQLMIDLRRVLDLLIVCDDVDPERIAYIGYIYGGAMGGLLAGTEPRIKAFGLIVGMEVSFLTLPGWTALR